ncbi:MAG: hypothetical protein HQ504_03505 [Rhodospirillaceae bacterium]|nr:hypothetical protein [Rhodospirillaceae bacterium]
MPEADDNRSGIDRRDESDRRGDENRSGYERRSEEDRRLRIFVNFEPENRTAKPRRNEVRRNIDRRADPRRSSAGRRDG